MKHANRGPRAVAIAVPRQPAPWMLAFAVAALAVLVLAGLAR